MNVVGISGHRVVLLRLITLPMTSQVRGQDTMVPFEIIELRREVSMIGETAMNEDQRRIAPPCFFVGQCDVIPTYLLHHCSPLFSLLFSIAHNVIPAVMHF